MTQIKKAKRERKVKIKYPRLSALDAFKIVKKVVGDYGYHIIPYNKFAKILGLKEPKGGTYGFKTEALKLYDLMDRASYNEIGVTEKGREILSAITEEEQKKLLFMNTLSIDIFFELFDRFMTLPTKRKAIIDYLENKGMNKREAGRLTSVFMRNYEFFESLIRKGFPEKLEKEEKIPPSIDEDMLRMIHLIGSLFPSDETKNMKQTLDTLVKISKNKNLKATSALLESLNAIYADEQDQEKIKEGLEKAKHLIVEKIEEDLGVKFQRSNKLS